MSKPFSGRREDRRLTTGAGAYTADWNLPGQLYAAFLRADRAHAEIVDIDTAAAKAAAGVFAVYAGRDAKEAGLVAPPSLVQYPGRGGQRIRTPVRYALACDRVRFVGECVAMVVAASPNEALDAVEQIAVRYNDLPVIAHVDDALDPAAPAIFPEIPGNTYFEFEYGDSAKTAQALAAAAHVTRVTVESQRVVGNPMEPKSCLAAYDLASDSYDVYCPSQGLSMLREALSVFTRVPEHRLRCHARDVGGGFGIRSSAYSEYAALMLAAKRLQRPVKWQGTRSESFLSEYHGRAVRLQGELGIDDAGRFVALRARLTCDLGAYHSEPGALINTLTPMATVCGAYRIPLAYGLTTLVATNTIPITAYRGAGRPDIAYLVERLVDEAAHEIGGDRIELRQRNVIPREAFPYQSPTAQYDSADFPGALNEASARADWSGFARRRRASRATGKLRGIGCAAFIEPSGGGRLPNEETAIQFGSDGSVTLYTQSCASGQGHETVFPEIVAAALGIEPERVTLRASDPAGPDIKGAGTIGSRSTLTHGSALLLGAREVVRKGLQLAAQELEAAAADVEFANGEYRVAGTDRHIGLLDLARKLAAGGPPHPLDSIGIAPNVRTFPSGVHIAEVEIDPETGVIEVLRYTGVDDCGRVIHPVLLEGQIHGGIAQGAGQVLGEQAIYDRATGQLLTASFLDYFMPRADMMGTVELRDRSVPSPVNALGVKGAGEAGTTGAIATLVSAVLDALRSGGASPIDMPMTPARVWRALNPPAGTSR